jgi:hypothetical protein
MGRRTVDDCPIRPVQADDSDRTAVIMTTTFAPQAPAAVQAEFDAASHQLFRCEQALHEARQTGVDQWIAAAADRLHEALLRQLHAEAECAQSR